MATVKEIELYNLIVKLFEAVDQRPKAYCIDFKDGYSSEFYTFYDMNYSRTDNRRK